MSKLKYRNTGFMRQILWYRSNKYSGIEIGKWYVRYYHTTLEGAQPRYKEVRL